MNTKHLERNLDRRSDACFHEGTCIYLWISVLFYALGLERRLESSTPTPFCSTALSSFQCLYFVSAWQSLWPVTSLSCPSTAHHPPVVLVTQPERCANGDALLETGPAASFTGALFLHTSHSCLAGLTQTHTDFSYSEPSQLLCKWNLSQRNTILLGALN